MKASAQPESLTVPLYTQMTLRVGSSRAEFLPGSESSCSFNEILENSRIYLNVSVATALTNAKMAVFQSNIEGNKVCTMQFPVQEITLEMSSDVIWSGGQPHKRAV